MRQMNRISSTASTPIALPLLASSPSIIKMNQQSASDTPKAINHMGAIHHNGHPGHPGVAEPLTWQQVESELVADQSHKETKETSTSKDGISTWILLSGSDNKPQTPATPITTASIVGHVDKINVKDVLNERHNYRFQQIHPEKVNKPIKIRDQPEKRPKPNKKDKVTIESTTTLKTTPMLSSTLSGILVASDFATDSKHRRKVTPLPIFNKKKTTTTTTTTEAAGELTEKLEEEHTIADKIDMSDEYPVDVTTPTSFIVLEPKDANFEIPEDRSPTPKKPKKGVKKGVKPSKKKTGIAKNPSKSPKPLTSTIYSYLSREVMPTVGIGLMGMVLTAGLAGYFFGPLGALRRSYDQATDRQDNVDNIYSVNNEEYASEGNDHGQNEEEVFSKFLAGMPANYVSRYVKYYRPDGNANGNPNQYNYRRVSQPQLQQAQPQASNIVPKYTPYMRYRTAPSPHYNPAQYNPQHQQQYAAYHRNHHMSPQSAGYQQQQVVSPVYNPQKQKSFATEMENVLKHQTATIYGKKNDYTIVNPSVVQEKSVGAEIAAEPEQQTQQLSDVANEDQNTELIEGEIMNHDNTATSQRIQRRTYVITDNQPAEAIVSASMTASIDGGVQKETNEPVFTVTATSHGPRRRRRRDTKSATDVAQTTEKEMKTTTTTTLKAKTNESQPSTTTQIITTTIEKTRLYSTMEYANLESEYNMLHEKLMSFDRDYSSADNEKKVEKKIQTEFKSIKSDFDALKKAIDGAKAIEQFQKQIHIRPKNFELSVVLKSGITGIQQRIRYLNDLIEHPEDDRIIEKINRRDGGETPIESTTTSSSSTENSSELPDVENGFVGFLKLLQLKAQFGLNLLKNIRPSFERAFEDVFKRPYVNRM